MRFWRLATPIKKARLQLAEDHHIEDLKQLSEITFGSEFYRIAATGKTTNREILPLLTSAIGSSSDADTRRREINREIDQKFFTMINSAKLRCFAFEYPRQMSSEPVEMFPEHWTHYPLWDTGEFKANGLHLIELRVIESLSEVKPSNEVEQIAPGRPSIEKYVTSAFHLLRERGKIDTDSSAKSHYPMVRSLLASEFPDRRWSENEPTDEGIRRYFSPLFRKLKETSKQ